MTTTTTIILAAGTSELWTGTIPRQLVNVFGETLLARTQRQCQERGLLPITVTQNRNITAVSHRPLYPSTFRWLVDTLYSTRYIWGDRVIVLLGDVVYSEWTIDSINRSTKPVMFFGSYSDIFGLVFTDTQQIELALQTAIEHAELGGEGKLWDLLSALKQLDPRKYVRDMFDQEDFGDFYCLVNDMTADFDDVGRYSAYIREYGRYSR